MLPPDEAKRQLARFEVANIDAALSARAAKLSSAARPIAEELLAIRRRELSTLANSAEGQARDLRHARAIDALSDAERVQLFTAFLPRLGREAERAWRNLALAPYQTGYARRAFRAPSCPNLTASKRVDWLGDLLDVFAPYEQDAAWFAVWTGHFQFPWRTHAMGRLLADVIDAGGAQGDQVLGILQSAARGEHEIAVFDRYVVRALATSSRPEAWACLEDLVLRAQREEGLRQVVFETVDEAHPECFRRMLALVAEHGLARFSAVARATDVWLGMAWDSEAAKHVDAIAERLSRWIPDTAARRAALGSDSGEDVYLALFAEALEDALSAAELARPLLAHANAEVRFAAVYLLDELGHTPAKSVLTAALEDPDRRVAARAIDSIAAGAECEPAVPDLFERLEAQLARWPARATKEPAILWPWCVQELDRGRIGRAMLEALGERSFARFEPHLSVLDVPGRVALARATEKRHGAATSDARAIVVRLLGDASPDVRSHALKALKQSPLQRGEDEVCEALLARKADDLRLGVLGLLFALDDDRVRTSVERLLASGNAEQRAGGLELLRRLHEARRMKDWCRERAAAYRAAAGERSAAETAQFDAILAEERPAYSLDDALGLSPPSARTPIATPQRRRVELVTRATRELLVALDALVAQHAATSIAIESPYDHHRTETTLGELRTWAVVRPADGDRAASRAAMPLREVFEAFWSARPATMRDTDGLEGVRALVHSRLRKPWRESAGWFDRVRTFFGSTDLPQLAFADPCCAYLGWFLYLEPPARARAFVLDALEEHSARLPADARHAAGALELQLVRELREIAVRLWNDTRDAWSAEEVARLWNLQRFFVEHRITDADDIGIWSTALEHGVAKDADLLAHFLHAPYETKPGEYDRHPGPGALDSLSGQRTYRGEAIPPRMLALVQRVRERLIEIELARGEAPTVGSSIGLRWTGGLDVLVRTSRALQGGSLRRGMTAYWSSAQTSREESLSRIAQRTRPAAEDTLERFSSVLPPDVVGEERLLEIALFAPQWCRHVEHALGWAGLSEGVWWMHAHTKDAKWSVDKELRELWSAQTSERTPLSSADLLDGAVDVDWFARVRAALGDERVLALLALAKFTSSGTGHTRAKLFASALLGEVTSAALLERVRAKRHLDSVRALGLVPLPTEELERAAEVLARYLAVQEFVRGSKEFGSARQASEKRAASIGLENLARTAGYADPVRLEWAMERAALGELARGSVRATAGEVDVELSIDADGDAVLVATKKGKVLKSLPPAAKKDAAVKPLVDQAGALAKQKQRMRASLESAMIRGDVFTGAELAELFEHPVLAPMLARLVLCGDGKCGVPVQSGRVLRGPDGAETPLDSTTRLRIAHPVDLLASGAWPAWQRDALRREVVQPFKQLFRELYVLTDAEREERVRSRRYAGHQVRPRQAMALLGTRGWVWNAEEGARRVDHASGLAASIEFLHAPFTPAEVEGLTIETIVFTRRGEQVPLPLESIPPRLLSEVLRDVDLVVSVANRSGVDPEASASSIEARAALVRETCALLGLPNVAIDGRRAVIDGRLGRYTLHLGSGVVHKLPGGHLCIVPVHAQHRGRVFLPFADDDPKTAEILSKVLLLARDGEIKDPTILEQIRR